MIKINTNISVVKTKTMSQINIFQQQQKKRSKQRYDKFYAGVKERYEKARRDKEKREGMSISILHGEIPTREIFKNRKNLIIIPKT